MPPSLARADTPFHPPAHPRLSGRLEVDDEHVLCWEESGPADGAPVVVLHGGPGAGAATHHRRLFDPRRHRMIAFDQRGCGRSTPLGAHAHNTTAHLVTDIERLREARSVERWAVAGGSWGSTLALAYAQAHPERVSALVVSGVFLARRQDVDWWWEGARMALPEVFAARDAWLPPGDRGDPRAAFLRRILDPDPAVHAPATAVLAQVEAQMLDLQPPPPPEGDGDDAATMVAMRLFAHYAAHDFFLEEDQLLRDAPRLRGVPGAIVAGRADLCTPPKAAYDLAEAWPDARLTLVPAAGHRWSDPALAAPLIAELARLCR